jgi:hypothetical protein
LGLTDGTMRFGSPLHLFFETPYIPLTCGHDGIVGHYTSYITGKIN